ncbi:MULTISPECIES: bifunctional acetaldehyde-CoA/alcohol dehydrogenase [Streptococcus]|jgi:acetaldehyde dehydrogenase/alcohol dehydrogenase|uniref:bifunctional acetaldehyde-CoA/alcohol dehydrogenase n=1 Tax=Streptococcus TaxID=1301 RepID=UPI000336FB51|nr:MULTISPECIES: bifunctional acetaldehyde-CoA/alcohol dehydrogenase [Streptococcus]CDF01744.1 aldehyde-alcohol dehydrogenase 2 [Streptococcus salivarius CAG:79]MDB8588704.1 bifunctional acetaldehyde-CoA/alcohol dehydrogenase [Streptococcus salivarius]MEB3644642.1 bifunctional acetaldehyde-CoA/alcohol dehydrogenase [Streptococcus salivarius]OHQ19115.1 bifunctional acetaldehyde-CoA/alcohol dehydrogenase [Streptococcus sp. HMSC065H07]UOT91443.1 bifunctional acetaldehyde-CoA/alcohol dehydrogenase
MTKEIKQTKDIQTVIDELAIKGVEALNEMADFTQEQVDHIVHQAAIAALDKHMYLAKLAVDETGRGIYEDKAIKNMYASEYIWNSIKNDKTVGVIAEDKEQGLVSIAEPVGVICGVTPTTNPTSTTIFKALIALKTRNSIVFAFHPSAQKSSAEAARIVRDAAIEAGAPKDCIQWIEEPSIEATGLLMNHPKIATVLATGGPGMVKAAYSTGKPALGVGAGNVPSYIAADAKVKRAVNDIIVSKTFDNGMICASEQAAIVDAAIYDEVKAEFEAHQCVIISKKADIAKLEKVVLNEARTAVNGAIVGHSAIEIAEKAGLKVPAGTKMLLAEIPDATMEHPLALEKLSPVLALIKSDGVEDGFKKAEGMLNLGGLGHTAVIHTENEELQLQYGIRMKACRVLVNSPSAEGGIGNIYNNMIPSLTLGCGSHGHNSVSHNVSSFDLLNVKTLSKRRNNMQWFRVPPKIFFEKDSITYLRHIEAERVMLVCDPGMVQFGYADLVKRQLELNRHRPAVDVFSDVEPNPSTNTVYKGLERFVDFQPDVIIALGGGSAMDAAKAMWMFFENPDVSFFGAKQKFLDIRKRTYKIPYAQKTTFICIPTTSGTGSEVTSFAVITDSETHIKYPLADYALTPDIAIVDPALVMSVPASVTADTGMDVLTHAIESYVSVMASDYTRGLSLQAIKLVFENLEHSYRFGDEESREKMHNASTMAGMAFANAFLGINHSLAHKVGPMFDIPHGRTNAILMPHVIRYNGRDPQKHAMFPKYDYFRADKDYADIARFMGWGTDKQSDAELVEVLAQKVYELGVAVGIDMNWKGQGVTKKLLQDTAYTLAEHAYEDQCTTANPKEPLISELKEIIEIAFDYKG